MQITWDSVEQLEDYTSRLRAAAEKLTTENRRLRRSHADLVVKVGGVMSVDLLRQPQRWKDMLMEIRHMMAALVQVRERERDMYITPEDDHEQYSDHNRRAHFTVLILHVIGILHL